MSASALIASLENALGPDSVLTGERIALRQTQDWSEADAVPPLALLLPRSTDDVSAALRICPE